MVTYKTNEMDSLGKGVRIVVSCLTEILSAKGRISRASAFYISPEFISVSQKKQIAPKVARVVLLCPSNQTLSHSPIFPLPLTFAGLDWFGDYPLCGLLCVGLI